MQNKTVLLTDQLARLISDGVPFVIAEVRGSKVDTINYKDKKTGQATSFSRLVYNCELVSPNAEQVRVSVGLSEEQLKDPAGVRVDFVKGDVVVVPVGQYSEKLGAKDISVPKDKRIEHFDKDLSDE